MLLGITGRAGSGKDSVASIVQGLYPELNWQIKGFADKLRQVASLLTGIPAEDMKRQEVKEKQLGEEWNYYKSWYRMDGRRHDVEKKFLSAIESIDFAERRGGYAEDCEEHEMTVRQFLQELGTQGVRDSVHPNAWVNALMVDYKPYIDRRFEGDRITQGYHCSDCVSCHKDFIGWKRQRACNECIDAGFKEYPNWIVCDTRFPNELKAITSRGGICIRVVRPDNPYPQSNHISETALDGVELLTIINDGNLDQLRIKVKEVFDPIVHRIRSGGISVA